MFDFEAEVQKHFGSVLSRFGLRVQPVDAGEVLLLGERFALSLSCDREGLDVYYIDQAEQSLTSYRLTTYLSTRKFTQNDRALYGRPQTTPDRVKASLRVLASGLENRCADLLNGDKAWLVALKRKDADAWRGDAAPPRVAKALAA